LYDSSPPRTDNADTSKHEFPTSIPHSYNKLIYHVDASNVLIEAACVTQVNTDFDFSTSDLKDQPRAYFPQISNWQNCPNSVKDKFPAPNQPTSNDLSTAIATSLYENPTDVTTIKCSAPSTCGTTMSTVVDLFLGSNSRQGAWKMRLVTLGFKCQRQCPKAENFHVTLRTDASVATFPNHAGVTLGECEAKIKSEIESKCSSSPCEKGYVFSYDNHPCGFKKDETSIGDSPTLSFDVSANCPIHKSTNEEEENHSGKGSSSSSKPKSPQPLKKVAGQGPPPPPKAPGSSTKKKKDPQ